VNKETVQFPGTGMTTKPSRPVPAVDNPAARKAAPSLPVPPPIARPVEETLRAVAAQIESYLRSSGRSLNFSVDSSTGRTVIAVRDANTGALIRQIPSEEALRLATSIDVGSAALVDLTA
jgi:flagellar protein FlaG